MLPSVLPSWSTLPAGAYREWVPLRRSQPAVCVVSVITSNLLGGWGGFAAEQNVNWALVHGYKYGLFLKQLAGAGVPAVWSKPRAALLMLQRGEDDCQVLFHLDGDAVVVDVNRSITALIARLLPAARGPSVIFSCHSPFGHGGACHVGRTCRCSRAHTTCTPEQMASMLHRPHMGAKYVPWCLINSGVYLVRNSPRSRELLGWWAGTQECKPGEIGRGAPEQLCAQTMKTRWAAEIDVVSARHFNTPAWFHSAHLHEPIATYEAARCGVRQWMCMCMCMCMGMGMGMGMPAYTVIEAVSKRSLPELRRSPQRRRHTPGSARRR